MATFNQDAILKLKVDSSDVKKGVDAAIKEVDRLANAIAEASKVQLNVSTSNAPRVVPQKAPTVQQVVKQEKAAKAVKVGQESTPAERPSKGLDGAAKKEFQKLMSELKKSLGQNLDFASGREKSKIQKSTLDKRFETMKKAEALYLQLSKDQKSLIQAFQANADSLKKVQKNYEERTKSEYNAPEISADRSAYEGKSTAEVMKMMVEAKKKLASLENQNNNPGAKYDKSSPAFDALAKSVESLVRQLSNSSGTEQIGYSSTNRQLGSGGARGFAAKSRNQDYTHVAMSDAIGKRLETGNMIREDLVTLIHEIRHAMQNEIERTGGQIEYLLDPKNAKESALVSKVGKLYENDPRTQAREADANIFAERTVDAIADALGVSFADLNTALGATKDVLKQLRAEYFEHKKALDSMDMDNPDYSKQEKLLQDAKSRVMGAFMDMGVGLDGSPTKTRPMINGKIDGQDEISSDLAENLEPFAKAQKKLIDYVSKIETGATKNPKADAMEKYLNIAETQRERLEVGESEVEDLEGTVSRLNGIIELLNNRLGREVAEELEEAATEATDLSSVATQITTAVEQLSIVKKALASIGGLNVDGLTKLENQLNQAAEIGASLDVVSATKNLIGKIEKELMSVADGSEIAGASIDLGAFSKKITNRVQDMLNDSLSDTAAMDLNIRLDDVQAAVQSKVDSTIADLKAKIDATEIIGNLPDVDVSELFVKVSKQIVEAITDYVNLLNSDIANVFEGKDTSEIQQALNNLQASLVESVKNDLYGIAERLTTPELDLSEVTKCLSEISESLSAKIKASLDKAKQVLNSAQPTSIDASEISNAIDNAVMGLSDVVSESQEDLSKAFRAASDKIIVPDFDLAMLQENINGFATRLNKKINALYKTLPRVIANEIKNAGATELDTSFLPEMMGEVGKKIANLVKESAEKMLAEITSVSIKSDNTEDIQKLATALSELNDRLTENFKQLANRIDSVSLVVNSEVVDALARSFTTFNEKAEDSLKQLSQVFDSVDLSVLEANLKNFVQTLSDKLNGLLKTFPKALSSQIKEINSTDLDLAPIKEAAEKLNNKISGIVDKNASLLNQSVNIKESVNKESVDVDLVGFQNTLSAELTKLIDSSIKKVKDQIKALPDIQADLSGFEAKFATISEGLSVEVEAFALKFSKKAISALTSSANKIKLGDLDLGRLNTAMLLHINQVIDNVKKQIDRIDSKAIDISNFDASIAQFNEAMGKFANEAISQLGVKVSQSVKDFKLPDLDLDSIQESAKTLYMVVKSAANPIMTKLSNKIQAEIDRAVEQDLTADNTAVLKKALELGAKKVTAKVSASLVEATKASLDKFEIPTMEIKGVQSLIDKFNIKITKLAENAAKSLVDAISTLENQFNLPEINISGKFEAIGAAAQKGVETFGQKIADSIQKEMETIKYPKTTLEASAKNLSAFDSKIKEYVKEQIADLVALVEGQKGINLEGIKMAVNSIESSFNDLIKDHITKLVAEVKAYKNPGNSDYIQSSFDGMSAKLAAVIENLISQAKIAITNYKGGAYKDAVNDAMKGINEGLLAYVATTTNELKTKIETQQATGLTGLATILKQLTTAVEKKAVEASTTFANAIVGLESTANPATLEKVQAKLQSALEKTMSDLVNALIKGSVDIGSVTKQVDTTDRLAKALTDKVDRLIQMSVMAINATNNNAVDFGDLSRAATIDVEKALHKQAYQMISKLHAEISSVSLPKSAFSDIKNMMASALKSSLDLNLDALRANEGSDKSTMLDNSEDIKKYLNEVRKAIGTALANSAAESSKTLKIDTEALDKVVAGVINAQIKNAAKNLKTVALVSPEIQAIGHIGEALSDRIELHVLSIAKSIYKVPIDFDQNTATSAAINIEKGINGLVDKTLQDYTQAMSSIVIKANLLEIKKKVKMVVENLLSKGIDDMSAQLINERVLSDSIKAKAEKAMDSLASALVRVIRNMADVADQMAERGFQEGDGTTVPGSPTRRTRVLSDAEVAARDEERNRANVEKDERRRMLQQEADNRRRMLQEEADARRAMLREEADANRRAVQAERAANAENRARSQEDKRAAVQEQEAARSQYDQDIEQVNVGLGFATDLAQTIAPNLAEGLDMFSDLFRQISSADQSVEDLLDSMRNVSAPTMFVGAVSGLGKILGTVAPVADSFQRLENILSTTAKIKFDSVKSSLMEMSRTLGTDLAASAEQFGQFASSLEGSALEGQAIGIFESVTKYSAALGMSTDAQNRSFTALTQIASKNKVQMEELQGQLAESLPGAVNKAAKALGITKAEMYDMMKAGELTATEFLPALARELENSAEAMSGFSAAPMSQQLQILKGQLTTGFVDLLLPIFDGFQGILQSVIEFSSETGAMGVVALTVFSSLVLVLAKSALGLQQNVALTTVLSKSLMVLRGFLVTTVAPMAALAALIAVGTTAVQAFNGELSKTSEVKSFKSLNETLEKTLDKLEELREKAKPNSIALPINLNGIQTNTKRIEELKEEYNELNAAQKLGSGISAAASKFGRFVTGKEKANYFDGGFKNEAQGDFASKTLEKEKEARDQAMKSVQNMIGAYDELLGLSNGLASNEMEAYKNAQAKESSLNKQENYYKSIASAASTIEMGDGSDPEKLAEIKATLEAINNNNKGQGFDLLKLENITDVQSALDFVKNAQGDILAQRDELADEMVLFDPELVKSGIETARLTLATTEKTDEAYVSAAASLKKLYQIQAALNGLAEKNLVTTKAFRDAYKDMVDQKADNEFTSSLVPKVAELDLYNRALKSGATDINDLTMEKRKIESASHHMRLKQLRQERAAMDDAAMLVDSDTLAKMSEITGNMKLATAKGLKMSMLTSEDMDKLLTEESQEKLSKPLFDFLSEYKESRQDNVAEQVDELLAQKELMFDISSEYAEFEAQAQEDLADYAQRQNDAVAGYNQTVQDTIGNMHDIVDSLNRAIEDVEIDTKALKIQNDSKAISNDVKRLITSGTGTLMSNLISQFDTFLGIQTEELTGELELTKEATQIKRSFEDGVLGIKSAFDDYLGAFRDFQNQLREIANEKAQKEAEIAAEKAKVQSAMNPTQADLGIFENPNGDKLLSTSEKMLSTYEYGIDVSQEQVAEAKKNGEAVRKQKEEAEKATQKLTSVDDRLAAMPQDIAESMAQSANLASQAGASPLLIILSEIKTAMIDGFNTLVESGGLGAGEEILGDTLMKQKDPLLMTRREALNYSADKVNEWSESRDKGIARQKAAMESFANGGGQTAIEDFAEANRMIAKAEQGIASFQTFLMEIGEAQKAASLNIGESAVREAISEGFIAITSKWGQGAIANTGAANTKAEEDATTITKVAATFGRKASEYFKTEMGFEKYQDGQVRDPGNTYTQDGNNMIKQAVTEAFVGTVDGIVAAQNQPINGISGDVVKAKDEALAEQAELQTSQLANLEENRRGKKLETEGKTEDLRIAIEKSIADSRENVAKMVEDLNNQRANAQKSPRDKAIESASSDSRSLMENLVNQRKVIKDAVDGLDTSELQKRLDAAKASGNSKAVAEFQKLIDETNAVANAYRELDTQLQLDIDSAEGKRQAEERYAAALFDAAVAAEAQFGARQADIGARLDDKYVDQNERNSLEREQLSNQMALDNPLKLDELIKKYEELGYSKEMSILKAKNALDEINEAEFDKLEDSLDTVGNKLESTLGDLFTEMFSVDPTQNITDQFLSIFSNIAKNLQQYAGEKLNGYIMDALFENDKPKTEAQADALAKEAANVANEAYKATTLSSVETKNAIDDEATESRGANLQSNASKMAGYIGAAASVVSAVQSGKTGSIVGSVLGGIAGAFLGGPSGAMMGSQLGGAVGGMFYNGGEVEAMMQKERTMSGGKQPRLIVAHAGEQVLTTKNKDAEAFRAMQASGVWDAMKSVSGYANGGTVGSKVSQARSGLAGILTNNNQKTTSNMTTVFNIQATEATLVPKLSSQLESKKRNLLG
jgi:tape measure domain-containing protein